MDFKELHIPNNNSMVIKKEISFGNIVSIASSLIMMAYVYGSLHFQVGNHEERINKLEASQIEMAHTTTVLATLMQDKDKMPQTIDIK